MTPEIYQVIQDMRNCKVSRNAVYGIAAGTRFYHT